MSSQSAESYIPHQETAREIARSVIGRNPIKLPDNILPIVEEMIIEPTIDGIEFGEGSQALPDDEKYVEDGLYVGYLTVVSDDLFEEGEQ